MTLFQMALASLNSVLLLQPSKLSCKKFDTYAVVFSQYDNMARIIFISFVELSIWTNGVET